MSHPGLECELLSHTIPLVVFFATGIFWDAVGLTQKGRQILDDYRPLFRKNLQSVVFNFPCVPLASKIV